MVAVTGTGLPVQSEDLGWYPVSDAGSVGTVRRAAASMGEQLGLPQPRLADLAIVATELASNLYKHARDGVVHVRALRGGGDAGVELLATDTGPGMVDLALSIQDGHSTAGTLGIGLGAMVRQATELDAFSRPEHGTVMAMSVWGRSPAPRQWAAGLTRPIAGETVSGDGYASREAAQGRQVMLCDGLGHGPLAAAASQAVAAAFRDAPLGSPAEVLNHVHRTVSHTRGAVVAVVELGRTQVKWASVGNIAGWVVAPSTRRGMTAQPGILGDRRARTIREYSHPLDADTLVVLHTDGLTDRWNLGDYPGLLRRTPLLVAATLMRDAAVRRDDAGVLVARPPAADGAATTTAGRDTS
jgi:anti-sigma regulatory factor (Ser/Thr protein kinase)